MAEVLQFTGSAIDQGWAEEVRPRGSRLIAQVVAKDYLYPEDSDKANQAAVFQSLKKPAALTVYVRRGDYEEPARRDRPIRSIRAFLERDKTAKILCHIDRDEFLGLINDEALAREEKTKTDEVLNLPSVLYSIQEKIRWIQEWDKVGDLIEIASVEDMEDALYSLNNIASDCIIMASNLSPRLLEKMEAKPARAEA